jgi:tetratricopeptide (TPR) repeat protein
MRLQTLTVIACTLCAAACGVPDDASAPQDLISEARRLDLDGQQDAAIALFRQALEREPDSFDAQYGIARALDLAGSYEEARRHFARAIELAPEGAREQALRMMGIAWAFVRDADQAAGYFREVFDRRVAAGNFPGASEVANELGRVYLELGDPDRAEAWYRAGHDTAGRQADRPAPQVDLTDLRWAHAQARIAARRGRAEDARRHVAAVSNLLDKGTNEDQRIHLPYLRGYVEFHLGDYEAAVTELQNANQDDPFILVLLAEASERLGDEPAARDYYARALESSSHAVGNALARPVARQRFEPGN